MQNRGIKMRSPEEIREDILETKDMLRLAPKHSQEATDLKQDLEDLQHEFDYSKLHYERPQ